MGKKKTAPPRKMKYENEMRWVEDWVVRTKKGADVRPSCVQSCEDTEYKTVI